MTVVAGFFGLTGIYTNATQGVIVDLPSALSWDGVRSESLVNVVTVFGSAFNDTILGDAGDNLIDGGPGGADR
jgi:RTX calcium-binding nonapeptide repeat (4 copies)